MSGAPCPDRSVRPAGARVLTAVAALVLLGCPGPERDDAILSGPKLYSQGKEELIARHFFRDRRDGFFVDVGAWHWRKHNTTWYLEEQLGWSGIAIDAQRYLGKGYRRHRPRTRFFAYIVSDHSGAKETLYLAGPATSTVEGHVAELAPAARDVELRETVVETITLDDLLGREGVERIDFLSMDIEGGEPAALAGFDIRRYRPELVCIEAAPKVRDAISDYFDRHGYRRIERYLEHDARNWYFTPRGGDAPE